MFKINILILSLFMVIACGKQESPSVSSDINQTDDEIRRSQICSGVDFSKNLIEHKNIVALFQCTKWDQEYPHLFKAMKDVQTESWNHLMMPVNQFVFADIKNRDKYFLKIKELDQVNGLDDLSVVIASWMQSNFYDSIFEIFNRAKQKNGILSKSELIDFFQFLNLPDEEIKNFQNFAALMNKTLNQEGNDIYSPMQALIKNTKFDPARINLIDALAQKFSENNWSEQDVYSITNFLSFKTNDEVSIHSILSSPKLTYDEFFSLIDFTVNEYPTMSRDFRILKSSFPKIGCKKYPEDPVINFYIENEIIKFGNYIAYESIEENFDYMFELTNKIRLADEMCGISEIRSEGGELNLLYLLNKFNKFLIGDLRFEFAKFSNQLFLSFDGVSRSDIYLVELLGSKLIEQFTSLNQVLIEDKEKSIFIPWFNMIRSFETEDFATVNKLVNYSLKNENRVRLASLSKFWLSLSPENKKFLLNTVDTYFKDGVNYKKILDFYMVFIDDLDEFLPIFGKDVLDGKNAEKTFDAILNISFHYKGQNVLDDLTRFFSRNHILKTIEIITSNYQSRSKLAASKSKNEDSFLLKDVTLGVNSKVDPKSNDYKRIQVCLDILTKKGIGFYDSIVNLPTECLKLESLGFSYKVNTWLNSIETDFRDSYPGYVLFDDKGLFSPVMMKNIIVTGDVFNKLFTQPDGTRGFEWFLNILKEHFFEIERLDGTDKNGFIDDFEFALKLVNWLTLENKNDEDFIKYRDELFVEIANINENEIRKYIEETSIILKDYAQAKDNELNFVEKHSCKNYFKYNLGYNPCPTPKEIIENTNNMIEIFKVKYAGVPTLAHSLIKAFLPKHGVAIPYRAPKEAQKTYILTLEELVMSLYDLSNANNKIEMVYLDPIHKPEGTLKAPEPVPVTTLDMIDVVIRDVSFSFNRNGTFYVNEIAKTDNFVKESKSKKFLISSCLKIKWCGVKLSKLFHRLAKNSLESFDGLIHIDSEYNHPYNNYGVKKYGNFYQTLLTTLVMSSDREAQDANYNSKDVILQKHKSLLLSEISKLSGQRNLGRFVRDRIGETDEEIINFIQSYEFQRVNKRLLRDFDLTTLYTTLDYLLDNYTGENKNNLTDLKNTFIEWVYNLDYQEQRLVENTIYKTLVMLSYIGVDGDSSEFDTDFNVEKYKANTLQNLIVLVVPLIELWPSVKANWPSDLNLIGALKPFNDFVTHINNGLNKNNNNPNKLAYYHFLNKTFEIFQRVTLNKVSDNKIGFEFFANFLKSRTGELAQAGRSLYHYINRLHKVKIDDQWVNDKARFNQLADNLVLLNNNPHFSFNEIQNYLEMTTLTQLPDGTNNPHYGELSRLSFYLVDKKENEKSNFRKAMEEVLVNESKSFLNFLDSIYDLIVVEYQN